MPNHIPNTPYICHTCLHWGGFNRSIGQYLIHGVSGSPGSDIVAPSTPPVGSVWGRKPLSYQVASPQVLLPSMELRSTRSNEHQADLSWPSVRWPDQDANGMGNTRENRPLRRCPDWPRSESSHLHSETATIHSIGLTKHIIQFKGHETGFIQGIPAGMPWYAHHE